MNKRGYFITFEGIDGCGKSTQIWMLGKHISELSKYNHVLMTREPWGNPDIRKILREDADPYSQGKKLAEMFVADRKEHASKVIVPQINRGIHVVSDRYDLSTLAYQQTQGVPLQALIDMHCELIMPDITFIVDVPVEVAMQRMKGDGKRDVEQKFEKQRAFIEQLRQNYLALKSQLPKRDIVIVDGTPSIQEIFEKQIKPAFDAFYQKTRKCDNI